MPTHYKRPAYATVEGYYYLLQKLRGETFVSISRRLGVDRKIVSMKAEHAATEMVDSAKETLVRELIPEVVSVYKALFQKMQKDIKDGKDVKIEQVDKLLKGMYVLDSDSLRKSVAEKLANVEDAVEKDPEDLQALLITRKRKKELAPAPPTIDVEPIHADTESDTPTES